jgi:hypothetical protein
MAILSGRYATVTVGALVAVPATNVSVNSKADIIDTTSFVNEGFDSHVIGLYSAEITLDLLQRYDGFGLKQGDIGSITIFDGDGTPGQGLTITKCILTAVNYNSDVKDAQKSSLTFATYGDFDFQIGQLGI